MIAATAELLSSLQLNRLDIMDSRQMHRAAKLVKPWSSLILGHSGIAITMDTYSHVLPELQREAADRMDQALGITNDDDQDPREPELGFDGA